MMTLNELVTGLKAAADQALMANNVGDAISAYRVLADLFRDHPSLAALKTGGAEKAP